MFGTCLYPAIADFAPGMTRGIPSRARPMSATSFVNFKFAVSAAIDLMVLMSTLCGFLYSPYTSRSIGWMLPLGLRIPDPAPPATISPGAPCSILPPGVSSGSSPFPSRAARLVSMSALLKLFANSFRPSVKVSMVYFLLIEVVNVSLLFHIESAISSASFIVAFLSIPP